MALVSGHRSKSSLFHRAFGAVVETADAFSRARNAAEHYEFLSHLSDEELAARGHARDTIALYVAERYLQD